MPAPHRRTHGPSLAKKIDSKTAATALDDRSNLIAARTRHAKKFEEAQARLAPAMQKAAAGSDLERRAAQVRLDDERARQFEHYDTAVREGRAKPPIIVLAPNLPPRYFLACIDCDWDIPLYRPEPRVPLCRKCRERREAKKVARRVA